MSPLLLKVLQISLASAVLIAAVVLFRFVLLKAKCSRGAVLVLWAAVGIRLLLPFSIGSAIGILPGLSQEDAGRAAARREMSVDQEDAFAPTMVPADQNALSQMERPAAYSTSPHISISPETLLLLAYFIGVTAMLVYYIVSFARLRRVVRRARSLGEGIYVSGEVDAAFTFGVFSPRIILPAGLPDFVGRVVVRHEDEHLRHGDHFWKPLANGKSIPKRCCFSALPRARRPFRPSPSEREMWNSALRRSAASGAPRPSSRSSRSYWPSPSAHWPCSTGRPISPGAPRPIRIMSRGCPRNWEQSCRKTPMGLSAVRPFRSLNHPTTSRKRRYGRTDSCKITKRAAAWTCAAALFSSPAMNRPGRKNPKEPIVKKVRLCYNKRNQ